MRNTLLIPVNPDCFCISSFDKILLFLNEFFGNNFKCSFTYDDDILCLQISKI